MYVIRICICACICTRVYQPRITTEALKRGSGLNPTETVRPYGAVTRGIGEAVEGQRPTKYFC